MLAGGVGTAVAALAAGVELVDHGVLPGKTALDLIDGGCSVPAPPEAFDAPGSTETGSFYSRARHRQVGFTIAHPPGHGPGSRLPLGIVLHAFGGTHASTLGGLTLARRPCARHAGRGDRARCGGRRAAVLEPASRGRPPGNDRR
jgi:hypothetical protein